MDGECLELWLRDRITDKVAIRIHSIKITGFKKIIMFDK